MSMQASEDRTTPAEWLKTVQAAFVVALLVQGQGKDLRTIQPPRTLEPGEWQAVLEAAAAHEAAR